jgi:hypothetical protein
MTSKRPDRESPGIGDKENYHQLRVPLSTPLPVSPQGTLWSLKDRRLLRLNDRARSIPAACAISGNRPVQS